MFLLTCLIIKSCMYEHKEIQVEKSLVRWRAIEIANLQRVYVVRMKMCELYMAV